MPAKKQIADYLGDVESRFGRPYPEVIFHMRIALAKCAIAASKNKNLVKDAEMVLEDGRSRGAY